MARLTKKGGGDREEKDKTFPVSPDELVGHGAQLRFLGRALASGTLPQSLLFTGPSGIGKATLAVMAAAALECERPNPWACGECESCRKTAKGIHPDIRTVTLEVNEKSGKSRKVIVMGQARERILKAASLPPYEGKRLVFLIDPADAMNANTQNALLKILEEPPDYVQFLLVTANPASLLPTVRSRCHRVVFHPLANGEMERFAESRELVFEDLSLAVSMASGRPARLLTLDTKQERAVRGSLLSALAGGLSAGAYPALAPRLEILSKEPPGETLAMVMGLVRDALRVANGLEPLVHRDAADDLRQVVRARGAEGLDALASRLAEAPEHFARNVNTRLFWDFVFLVP